MKIIISISFIVICLFVKGQTDTINYITNDTNNTIIDTNVIDTVEAIKPIDTFKVMEIYEATFDEFKEMLTGKKELDFKRAVFISENAFFDNRYDYQSYCKQITDITELMYRLMKSEKWDTSNTHFKHTALFNYMTQEYFYKENGEWIYHSPYAYNFGDPEGKIDWGEYDYH